jgi:hypothetical protein
MSAAVAVIWLVVFGIGVAVGCMVIVALSTLRKDRNARNGRDDDPPDDQWPERDHRVSGIAGHWDDGPRWPDEPAAPDGEGKS